jgi:hypothetical protein
MKNNNNDLIVFTLKAEQRDALFQSKVGRTLVVLEAAKDLNNSFESLTKTNKLDPFKVMRKLVSIYLRVRKSATENPYKGLRALLRVWVNRVRSGNLSGFEGCGWTI